MNIRGTVKRLLAACLLVSLPALSEDIDLFAGIPVDADTTLPSVIFVLDNTSNWSRQSQQWPDGRAQGQSEVAAIRTALSGLTDQVNVGLLEFVTAGNSNQDGGYVRFDLQKLTGAAQSRLAGTLIQIENNINSPTEKRNSNESWGDLFEDLYAYLDGSQQSDSGGGTPTGLADPDAYTTQWSVFESPLEAGDICTNTYVIFISNPNSSGPRGDESDNTAALTALYEGLDIDTPPNTLSGGGGGTPLPLPEVSTVSTPGELTILGESDATWKNNQQDQCTADESSGDGLCVGEAGTCGCIERTNNCSRGRCTWTVATQGTGSSEVTLTGNVDTESGADYNLDDWAKFLHDYGVPLTVTVDETTVTQRVPVITYTIDVYNAQPNAESTALMYSTADVGGGSYFAARSETQLIDVIEGILSDIISVSSSFSAVTLPVEAGQRTRSENEVYIGTFRPAQQKKPRWFGNLKRYQLGLFNNAVQLADTNYRQVINPLTGAPGQCTVSWWTEDTEDYWADLGVTPPPRSDCLVGDINTSDWSDSPDGPFVEKGGAAQQIRDSDSRTLYTMPGSANTALAALAADDFDTADVFNYLAGSTAGVDETMPDVGRRPAVHGGIIHSRPAVINYGAATKIFYGADDGLFHAVDSGTGVEEWAVIAPDHMARIARLYNNSPQILYDGLPDSAYLEDDPDPEAKDYFFDGATGQWVVYNDANVATEALIFPTMRRGGRQLFGLNVITPATPTMLWSLGCDSGGTCSSADFSDIGQTWSTPVAVTVDGYVDGDGDETPVLVFGGGWNDCLDTDDDEYACPADPNGAVIYIVDAVSGALVKKFDGDDGVAGPVVAEVSPIDIDFDGHADYVYAVDASGGLHRITLDGGDDDNWTLLKVAETSGDTRRLMNSPVPFVIPGTRKIGVAFGSGDRERPLSTNYPYAESVQNRMYALDRIDGYDALLLDVDLGFTLPIDLDSDLINAATFDADTDSLVDSLGWFFSLPDRGEQIVNPAAVGGGRLLFNSYQPGNVNSGLCSPALGIATAYDVPVFNPENIQGDELVAGGLPIPPVITTVEIEPEGYDENCEGENCVQKEVRTVCVGCRNFDVVELDPTVVPERDRVWWVEEVDE